MGHKFLIDTASKHSEKVYVLMCSLKREPIDGELRYGWLKEIYKDTNVEIIWVTDENPQYPEEDPINFWDIWLNTFNTHLPEKCDAVFSSEDYGFEIAKRMGIEHFLVDKERSIVPICATKIREDAHKYWEYIPDVVKPYFVKNIAIVGTESSGKSILAKNLANYYKTLVVEEYGRFYVEEINSDLELNDFEEITQGHIALTNEAIKFANKLLISDTEAVTTKVFCKLYCHNDYHLLNEYFDNIIKNQKFDKYILLDYDTPSVQDGTRVFLDKRKEHFEMIKAELKHYNIPYEIVSGNWEERFNKAVEIIKGA